ncbi:MAG: hypothetical protein Q9187_000812 [Circinaria calcarea]
MEPDRPADLAEAIPLDVPPPSFLPPPFSNSNPKPILVTQGAEALIFKTQFLTADHPCALKYRPSKPYRHPILDARLTRHRILSEARILVRCRREGVNVPGVLSLNWEGEEIDGQEGRRSGGWMMMEWIEGETVRKILDGWLKLGANVTISPDSEIETDTDRPDGKEHNSELVDLMTRIGKAVGKMHEIGIVHGDLTTSNLMLRPRPTATAPTDINGNTKPSRPSLHGDIVLIDFGLAGQNVQDEDKAVDLYVLERAFASTHPTAESLFKEVWEAYRTSYKGASVVLRKLTEVRMRGRKRSMLG